MFSNLMEIEKGLFSHLDFNKGSRLIPRRLYYLISKYYNLGNKIETEFHLNAPSMSIADSLNNEMEEAACQFWL